jgi:hypothetical protein
MITKQSLIPAWICIVVIAYIYRVKYAVSKGCFFPSFIVVHPLQHRYPAEEGEEQEQEEEEKEKETPRAVLTGRSRIITFYATGTCTCHQQLASHHHHCISTSSQGRFLLELSNHINNNGNFPPTHTDITQAQTPISSAIHSSSNVRKISTQESRGGDGDPRRRTWRNHPQCPIFQIRFN